MVVLSLSIWEVDAQLSAPMLTYDNNRYGITMEYPQDWQIDQTDDNPQPEFTNIVTFYSPLEGEDDENSDYLVLVEHNLDSPPDLQTYLDNTISGYQDIYDDFELLDSNANLELAGYPAYSLVFTYKWENEDGSESDFQSMQVGAVVGNKVYFFVYDAEVDSYSNFLPTVQRMINSLQFTTPPSGAPSTPLAPPTDTQQVSPDQPLPDGGSEIQEQQPPSPSPSPPSSPNTPIGESTPRSEGFMLYQNPLFSLEYPSSWQLSDNGSFPILVSSPPEGPDDLLLEGLIIQVFDNLENGTLEQYVAAINEFRSNQFDDSQIIESKPFGRLKGNLPSHYIVSLSTNPDLGPVQMMDVLATTDESLYKITYIAQQSQYTKYLPTVLNMLRSFEIVTNGVQSQQEPDNMQLPTEPGTEL